MQLQWVMKIFILEDDLTRIGLFAEALGELFHTSTDVATDMTEVPDLYKPPYDLLLLDHDLDYRQMVGSGDPNTGYSFVKHYMECPIPDPQPEIVIHSYNPSGAQNMENLLRARGYTKIAQIPFGLNLLKRLPTAGV